MVIRKFQSADLSQIMDIWLASNISAHPFVDQSYWIDHRSMVRDALLKAEVLVAVDGPTVLGFAGLQDDYLAGLFVKDGFRDQGIGTQLFGAVKKSHPSFTLSVYGKNSLAVQFYQRQDLEIIHRQIDETGNVEYIMRWDKG